MARIWSARGLYRNDLFFHSADFVDPSIVPYTRAKTTLLQNLPSLWLKIPVLGKSDQGQSCSEFHAEFGGIVYFFPR